MQNTRIYEFECSQCGYIWLHDANYGCPMCGKQDDVVRRDYVIPQPETFAKHNGERK